ncbi:MAG: hypothetical protein ACAI34_25985 [Verrucomicrobium sp.]|nr:hypothetical protein [Verrucomicrobium sp.]
MAVDAIFNLCEAALWFAISAVFLFFCTVKRHGSQRRESLLLAVSFAAFGISDVIESRTGAWWNPWWLLVLKGVCVSVFLRAFILYQKARRQAAAQSRSRKSGEKGEL